MTCPICGAPDPSGYMCRSCERSYDRTAHRDGSIMEAMVWAAKRARRAAEKRHRHLSDLQAQFFRDALGSLK